MGHDADKVLAAFSVKKEFESEEPCAKTKQLSHRGSSDATKQTSMSDPFVLMLIVLWLFGLASGSEMGGFIHVLPAVAVMMVFVKVIAWRKSKLRAQERVLNPIVNSKHSKNYE